MREKTCEEYWQLVGYRNYWLSEMGKLRNGILELTDRLDRLNEAYLCLRSATDEALSIAERVHRLPECYSEWKGCRAESVFSNCSKGDLYDEYLDYISRAESVLEQAEVELCKIRGQLEEAYASYNSAQENYDLWNGRTADYW